jgi:hypothetical protein
MFRPKGNQNVWQDQITGYEFSYADSYHYGDATKRICPPTGNMVLLNLVDPKPGANAQSVTVVVICHYFLVGISPVTGAVRTATVREALTLGRIPLGMSMDDINGAALSPSMFHEMFHAAMGSSGSKSFLEYGLAVTKCLAVLPLGNMPEKYPFEECAALSFYYSVINPNSHMFFALCKLCSYLSYVGLC